MTSRGVTEHPLVPHAKGIAGCPNATRWLIKLTMTRPSPAATKSQRLHLTTQIAGLFDDSLSAGRVPAAWLQSLATLFGSVRSRGPYLLAATLLCAATSAEADLTGWNKTALTSVAGTTLLDAPRDPDDPGVGGGIDTTAYFQTRLLPRVSDCTEELLQPITDWVERHDLFVQKKEHLPGALLVHATNAGLSGLFEFTYRVDAARQRARVTLFFYSLDGARHEIAGIRDMLETYAIEALQGRLDMALQCGARQQ